MTLQIRPTTIVCTAVIAGALPLLGIVKAQAPAFEVASIRLNTTTAAAGLRAMPNGRLIATNVPLRLVIQRAFKLHDAQIVGAPDWAATERFDLDARTAVPPAGGPDAVMPLLQPLLRDRFGLRAHMEVRDLPAYVLVVAHRDRPLGPHIRPTEADCSRATTLSQQEIRASARDGWPPCGMAFTVSYVASRTGGNEEVMQTRIRRAGITLQDLAAGLHAALTPLGPDCRGEWGHLGPMEFAVGVSNLERACDHLRASGVELLGEPQSVDVGTGEWRYAYLADPDGLYVSLVEPRF